MQWATTRRRNCRRGHKLVLREYFRLWSRRIKLPIPPFGDTTIVHEPVNVISDTDRDRCPKCINSVSQDFWMHIQPRKPRYVSERSPWALERHWKDLLQQPEKRKTIQKRSDSSWTVEYSWTSKTRIACIVVDLPTSRLFITRRAKIVASK
jgi:hypothetical protein